MDWGQALSGDIGNYTKNPIQDYSWLSDYLKGGATSGMPFKDQLLQTSTGTINKQFDQASKSLNENLSAKGLGSSGIGINAQMGLAGQQAGALNQATSQLNQQDINYRNQAIAQLLGLDVSQAQMTGQGLSLNLGQYNAQQQRDMQQQAQSSSFWGSIMGDVGGLLSAPYSGNTTSVLGAGISSIFGGGQKKTGN